MVHVQTGHVLVLYGNLEYPSPPSEILYPPNILFHCAHEIAVKGSISLQCVARQSFVSDFKMSLLVTV